MLPAMPMDKARYKQINLRLPIEMADQIDAERGLVSREAWLRHLIELGRQQVAPNRADMFRQATQGKRK